LLTLKTFYYLFNILESSKNKIEQNEKTEKIFTPFTLHFNGFDWFLLYIFFSKSRLWSFRRDKFATFVAHQQQPSI
jgi:hypothetical protein